MQRSEEIKVGLFVFGAVVLLVLALVLVGQVNVFRQPRNTYTLRTKFAGGVEAGAAVRYAGVKIGKVTKTEILETDPAHVIVTISVDTQSPIRTDSKAEVSSLGLLGENYIEIHPGSPEAKRLPSGSEIPVTEAVRWAELVNQFGGATGDARAMINDARPRVNAALDNIKDLTDAENREHVRRVLLRMDQILTDSQPRVKAVLTNFESSSAKIDKFMDDIKVTRAHLDKLLQNWGHLAEGDQADVQQTLKDLRETLTQAEQTMDEVRRLMVANREHLDVTLENMRVSSENIREFTDTVKQRPYSLVRVKNPPDRHPGDPEKKK